MTTLVVTVFVIVYAGMFFGGLPRLQLDRTGVALLGAIAIVGSGAMTLDAAVRAVHLPTILLLFSFMVISAQMRLGGFYTAVTRFLAALPLTPARFLAVVVAVVAGLSAVFSNDIVCLAVGPVLAGACLQRRLDPVPFLLALAMASNIGSALTLIGNPQNMLIGEMLGLSFAAYTLEALPPVVVGLVVLWAITAWSIRRGAATPVWPEPPIAPDVDAPPFDRWQTRKGLFVAGVLVVVFLVTDFPRDLAALIGAGVLLLSRRFHSSSILGLIDWELLVLFIGLFVVNLALEETGATHQTIAWLAGQGVALGEPAPLFISTLVLSNVVSNVPAVMLLLPAAGAVHAGPTLALVSTLAGNLLIAGSVANIIVVEAARKRGVDIDWWRYAKVGVPVTVVTLAITALWLHWRT